uniref:Uncharacterized protein n=1 Tax=Rhabditophanes sp. KR3021 TaxID=114890 RepID=A0AC35TS10_9BILA
MWEERKHLSVESQNKTNLNYRYQLISNRKLFYIVQLFMSGLSCTTLGGSLLLLATQYKLFSFRFSSNLFDLCYAAGMLCVPGVVTFCLRNSIKVRILHKSNITRIQELTVTTEVKRKNIHAGDEYFKRLKNSWANP